MKKTLLTVFAVAITALFFSSCKKCTTCSYQYLGTTVSSGEYCGKSDDVDTYEAAFQSEAALLGANATCVRK